jgi:NCAIR mutase (PurE)-related protein
MSLRDILDKVSRNELSPAEAEKMLKLLSVEKLDNLAKLDGNREHRKGIPEVILAEGKAPSDVVEICQVMLSSTGRVIVSRCSKEHLEVIRTIPTDGFNVIINDRARMAILKKKNYSPAKNGGRIGILTAGTSDIHVAEEAKTIAEEMGCTVYATYDVGVAGIHRLLEPIRTFIANDVDVVIVVAGREGALASVVSGLVDIPVIAVPTSNSYGFGAKGVSTLMAMLQSCSLGLAVVNIDGGVPAGAVATLIASRAAKFRK